VKRSGSVYIGPGRAISVFDPWKNPLCTCPFKYSLQPYTGCSHRCLYCYATAYIRVRRSVPKSDFLRRLARDLLRADPRVPISMSNSSDPYPPEEQRYMLTRRALEMMIPRGFRVLIVTKGALVARDADILSRGNAAVTITITTLDEGLARRLEPGAPPPGSRLRAIEELVEAGVPVGVRLDPVIPFLNDDPKEIEELIDTIASIGVKFVVTSTYKARPDNLKRMKEGFPELAERFDRLYRIEGERIHGYWYLRRELREKLLRPVIDVARKRGLEYATCREGFRGPEWFRAGSCDGTHLIPQRIPPRKVDGKLL